MPCQRRVLAHRNCRALTVHAAGASSLSARSESTPTPPGGTLSATMPEQLIDTRFPGQQFPAGSVVTLLDRHRRTVFPAVTELRRHEAIVGGGEAGRWRVRCARLQLITAGPTDRTRDR